MSEKNNDLLCKYNLLSEDCKKTDKICFKKFNGDRKFIIESEENNINTTMYVQVGIAENLKIYLDDIKVYDYQGIPNVYIPIIVNKSKELRVVGECEKLVIIIVGATFKEKNKNYYLDAINTVVEDCGEYKILQYNSLADYICGNSTLIKTLDNVLDAKTFKYNNQYYCGVVYQNLNGVYFSSSIDNYNSSIFIVDNCDSIVLISSVQTNKITFVYLIYGELYQVVFDVFAQTTSAPVQINIPVKIDNGSIFGLYNMQMSNVDCCFVAINVSNKYLIVYDVKYEIIVIKLKINDNNVVILSKNNKLIIIQKLYKKLQFSNIIYVYENNKYLTNQNKYCVKDNVDNCFAFCGKYILTNCLNETVCDDIF